MIYQEEIIINGKTNVYAFEPCEVWSEIGGYLQAKGMLGEKYKIGVGMQRDSSASLGETFLVDVREVENLLKKDEGKPILSAQLPKGKGIGALQRISYHSNRGILNASGRKDWFPDEWDSFFLTSLMGEKIVNVLVKARSYVSTFSNYKTPPNNDLLKALGLSNDRGDYIEGVSAEMWFGESFWQYAACSKEDVLACDWLKCHDRGFQLHVEAWDGPFTSAEGEQGKVQRDLLSLLFGIQ